MFTIAETQEDKYTNMSPSVGLLWSTHGDAGRAGSAVNCQCRSWEVYWPVSSVVHVYGQARGGPASRGVASGHPAPGPA